MDAILTMLCELMSNTTPANVLSGLTGGIVALHFEKEKVTVLRGIILLFSGVAGASYLGEATCEWWGVQEKSCDAIKFIFAMSAMKVFEGILLGVEILKRNPMLIINRFLPTNSKKNEGNNLK